MKKIKTSIKPENMHTEANPLYNLTFTSDLHVHISGGNSKIGYHVLNVSTLPGSHLLSVTTEGILTNIHGTCDGCCEFCENGGCYAVASAKQHHNKCIPSWGENTLILRNDPDRFYNDIRFALSTACDKLTRDKIRGRAKPTDRIMFRYNVSGEVESYDQWSKMNKIAIDYPDVMFAIYTKRFDMVCRYIKENGDFAPNFCVNLSEWNHNLDKYDFLGAKLNIFSYDDGLDKSLSNVPHCPGIDKNGRHVKDANGNAITCERCGICFRKTGRKTAVYAH